MARLINEMKGVFPHNNNYSVQASNQLKTEPKIEKQATKAKKCSFSLKLDNLVLTKPSNEKINYLHVRKNSVNSVTSLKGTPRNQEKINTNRHLRSNSIAGMTFSTKPMKKKENEAKIKVEIKKMTKEKIKQKGPMNSNIIPLSKDIVMDYRELDLKLQIENIVKQGMNIHKSYQKL